MPTCQIQGHPATYGLGIRLAFYEQWFGIILATWLLEADALNLKFLNGLTISATAIGLAIHGGSLQPAEVHVVLLLLCGTLYFLIPVYLLRFATCWRPWWDTERWTRMRMGWLFRTAMALLFGALLGAQIWFWSSGVYYRPVDSAGVQEDADCEQYAFLLGQVRIDSQAVTAVNIVFHLAILILGCLKCAQWVGLYDDCAWYRARKKRRWRIPKSQVAFLQQTRTIFDIIVASILTAGVELVIAWNHISNVNNLDTAAQLIPTIISGAYVARSIYVWMATPPSTSHQNHQCYARDFPYSWGDEARSNGGRSYSWTEHSAGPRLSSTAADYFADDPAWWYYWASQRQRASRRKAQRRQNRRSARNHQYDAYGAMPYQPQAPMDGAEVPPEGQRCPAAAAAAAAEGEGGDGGAGGDANAGANVAADGVAAPDPTVNPPEQPEAPG